MIPKQNPPGETACTVSGKWDHAKLPPGGKLKGWLAGPPAWLPTHSIYQRTLPCRREITGGKLACPHCSPTTREEWKGLLPFWNELQKQCAVWVNLTFRDHIESLPNGCMIVLMKGKNPKDSIEVRHELWQTTELPAAKLARCPCDPTPAALVWWRDPELTQWCIEQRGRPAIGETPAQRDIAAQLAAHLAADAGTDGGDTGVSPSQRNEAFARAVKATAGAKNGKHPKAEE